MDEKTTYQTTTPYSEEKHEQEEPLLSDSCEGLPIPVQTTPKKQCSVNSKKKVLFCSAIVLGLLFCLVKLIHELPNMEDCGFPGHHQNDGRPPHFHGGRPPHFQGRRPPHDKGDGPHHDFKSCAETIEVPEWAKELWSADEAGDSTKVEEIKAAFEGEIAAFEAGKVVKRVPKWLSKMQHELQEARKYGDTKRVSAIKAKYAKKTEQFEKEKDDASPQWLKDLVDAKHNDDEEKSKQIKSEHASEFDAFKKGMQFGKCEAKIRMEKCHGAENKGAPVHM